MRHLETPDRYLGPRIKFLYHAFNRKFMETARANGVEELTSMHGRILGYLYWSRPKDVYNKDIEEHFNITRSSVAVIVKLMNKKGYISAKASRRRPAEKLSPATGTWACDSPWRPSTVEGLAIRGCPRSRWRPFVPVRCHPNQSNSPKEVPMLKPFCPKSRSLSVSILTLSLCWGRSF
ncbi:MAG: MarR family transcriptional regulator [Evtepia gabavorous]